MRRGIFGGGYVPEERERSEMDRIAGSLALSDPNVRPENLVSMIRHNDLPLGFYA